MSNSITSQTPLPHPLPASVDLGPLVGKNYGGYEITSYIGEGPTGAVYRAEDLVGGKMVIKVMHQELSRKDAADQLWADLQKLTALGERHLPNVCDAGFGDDGEFFYVTDELIGCDLEAGLEESGALSPRKALEIVRQVCAAVEAAHAAGVVHGGLKPRNIFLSPSNRDLVVKVLDFGAARLAGGIDKGVIVGNPFYMAPEQFGGTAEPRTDVYALGVLMYELFSGTLPFAGPSHGQVMMRHLAEAPAPPPGVDPELGHIILRALCKAPAGRYPSVRQLREAVEAWARSSPRLLEGTAAFHVVARATEARQMKQAALSVPDATAQVPKVELVELARATRQELGPTRDPKRAGANPPTENPNSSESVEASLEDFISQANASFPTSDGWDLHTGDVELVDEDDAVESDEHVKKPLVVRPRQVEPATAEAPLPTKRPTSRGLPAVAAAPAVEPSAETVISAPPVKRGTSRAMPAVASEAPAEKAHWPAERTDVVSGQGPRVAMPWTANPLVIIGGLLAAFLIGAGLVFLMVRTMLPSGPVVVQAPAPQVVVQAAPPAPVAPPPVVTPLPPANAAAAAPANPTTATPVVTPLGSSAPAPAPVAAPVPAAPARQPVVRFAPHPKKKHVAEPKRNLALPDQEAKAPAEKPAAPAPKKEAPAKKESATKGGDWVDPFAQ
jgi:serine/threonine protein kinase